MDKIELLKAEIDQKKFKCNQEHSRFLAYIVFVIVIFLTGDLSRFNWNWFFIIILFTAIVVTLDRLKLLRKKLDKEYNSLFKHLKK